MKKLLTIFLGLAICSTVHAAAWNWSVAGKSFTTSNGENARAADYYVAVFLYSDYSDISSIITGGDASAIQTGLSTFLQSSGVTTATGATSGKVTGSTESAGTTLEIFTIAFDAKTIADATMYLVSSKANTEVYEGTAVPATKGAFTANSYSNSSWTPISAVPEPSTAALALAGLALLLKRRKA